MHRTRKGFTLLEVLMAVVLIGVLIALLLPAVNAAMRAGRRASVVSEISMFGQGLAGFTLTHSASPPSRFVCSEDGDYSTAALAASGPLRDEIAAGMFGTPWASLTAAQRATATATIDRLAVRTTTDIRGLWSKVRVSRSGPMPSIPAIGFYDFNGDGVINPPYLLTGDECLAFFLGGIPKPFKSTSGAVGFGMIGFATSPTNPFLPESYIEPTTSVVVIPGREPASVEFRSERLNDADGDGVPNYADIYSGPAFPTPYAYFAPLAGMYDPDDCNFATEPDGSPSPSGGFAVGGLGTGPYTSSPAPNPYTLSSPLPTTGANYATATLATSPAYVATWANAGIYQILSAGQDRRFGPGGWWDAKANDTKVPFARMANQSITGTTLGADARQVEKDNLANFAAGPLD